MKLFVCNIVVIISLSGSGMLIGNEQSTSANRHEFQYQEYLYKVSEYVKLAIERLPAVKSRYWGGELDQCKFYVVTVLRDSVGRWEQVYMKVSSWNDSTITAKLASNMKLVKGFPFNSFFIFEEDKVLDFMIIYPDGRKEGNYIIENLARVEKPQSK